MNILFETISILENEGYKTQKIIDADKFYFEDESLLGFVSIHKTIREIVEIWKDNQDEFLNLNAPKLRNDPTKAWNIYTIFLTSDTDESHHIDNITGIEEDFRGSRKIIGYGLQVKNDLIRILLPLLSIQKIITIQPEDTILRLRKLLNHPELLGDLSDKEILDYLIDKK